MGTNLPKWMLFFLAHFRTMLSSPVDFLAFIAFIADLNYVPHVNLNS